MATDRQSKSNFTYRLLDLLRYTAYASVIAWMIAANWIWAIPVWIGAAIGIEIGRSSSFPTLLISICGAVGGLAFSMALFGTLQIWNSNVAPFGASVVWWPTFLSWLIFLLIVWWISSRVRGN